MLGAPRGTTENAAAPSGWSIAIAASADPELARVALDRVRTRGGLPEAYLEKRGDMYVVACGHYDDPSSKRAQSDLARVHAITIDNAQPFAGALMSPPPERELRGSLPQFNLADAARAAARPHLYSLQIGVYGRPDRKAPSAAELTDFRKAAEQAAVQLRREGEEAYYYHAPAMSMVTIGLFGPGDIDPQRPTPGSTRIKALMAAHPYNLLNGRGIRHGKGEGVLQPSFLVEAPR